jgi:hypothetical protein
MTEIKFLIDAQLPPALARFLAAKSGAAVHVADLGAKDATDSWIWDKALGGGGARDEGRGFPNACCACESRSGDCLDSLRQHVEDGAFEKNRTDGGLVD